MSQSIPKMLLASKRPPRVRLEYELEFYGAEKTIELPFIVGVLTDLSGKPEETPPPVNERNMLEIDIENFDDRLRSIKPRVSFVVPNTLNGDGNFTIEIIFESMDDFSPSGVVRKVEPLNSLLEKRTQLDQLLIYINGRSTLKSLIAKAICDPVLLQLLTKKKSDDYLEDAEGIDISAAAEADIEIPTEKEHSKLADFFFALKNELAPLSDSVLEFVEMAVQILAEHVLRNPKIVFKHIHQTIETIISRFDRQLNEQVNLIIHHHDFLSLERAWRGLFYLVYNTDCDEMLKIRFMNISKPELYKALVKYKGIRWDTGPIFKKIYTNEYDAFGGEPYGCIVGDYYFENQFSDLLLLGEMAKICAVAHCPFITGTSPKVMYMDSWQELSNPRDLSKIFQNPDFSEWLSLRKSLDSRYIHLTLPRFLGRIPYNKMNGTDLGFDFKEDTRRMGHEELCWINSAYAMAVNINRAYKLYGWFARIYGIENGGVIEKLPVHPLTGKHNEIATEISISDKREIELSKNGFMALVQLKNAKTAAFISAHSFNEPRLYDDEDATAIAALTAHLPYILAECRFAHFVTFIMRDKIGAFRSRADAETYLTRWINRYVGLDPLANETAKARRPLTRAKVVVKDIEGEPDNFIITINVLPRYQMEGLTGSKSFEVPEA